MHLATAIGAINAFIIMTLQEITTLEKLNNAFNECAIASHWKESTQRYRANLLTRNLELQDELLSGNYRVSDTIDFTINERGKIRQINAPSVRDRVAQKVLCQQILIPQLSKPLIYDNYASLKGRGTAFARKRIDVLLRKFLRKHGIGGYVLLIDIKTYFGSIDHAVLKVMVHKRIHEPDDVMALIDYFIDTSSKGNIGLNLGAEAPQIFAIYFLSGLDNYVKSVRGVKYYGRYMDDMFIFSDSKEFLRDLLEDIKKQLKAISLSINEKKTQIVPLHHGFTFMQIKYNIEGDKIIKRPTRAKIVRERRRLKKYKKKFDEGKMTIYDIQNSYKSWRNSVLKDCPQSKRTIREMDMLYDKLFPTKVEHQKQSRERLIRDAFKEKEARYVYYFLR